MSFDFLLTVELVNLELLLRVLKLLQLLFQILDLTVFEGNILLEVTQLGLQEGELLAYLLFLQIKLLQNRIQILDLNLKLLQIFLLKVLLELTHRLSLPLHDFHQSLENGSLHPVESLISIDSLQVSL